MQAQSYRKIRDYTKKISVIFSPVFFGLAGAQFDIRSFLTTDWSFYGLFALLVAVAIISKVIGCGVPAALFLKDRSKGLKVGVGMISRGEVGLIVAGVAISARAITQSIYSAILGMIIITTILAPILLKKAYDKEPTEDEAPKSEVDTSPPDYIPTYPLNFSE